MGKTRDYTRGFNGGIISPELFGIVDSPKVRGGAETMRNYEALPHGPASMRPGTLYCGDAPDHLKKAILIPFVYSTSDAAVILLGDLKMRVVVNGALLTYTDGAAWVTATSYTVGQIRKQAGVNYYCREAHTSGTFATDLAANKWAAMPTAPNIYEIPSPWAEADIFDIHHVQSNDVITAVHPSHQVREIRRYGVTDWRIETVSFLSSLTAPTSPTAVATVGTGSTTYEYQITAVDAKGLEESLPTATASCTNNLFTTGNYNTISWTGSGAPYYNVYKKTQGLFAYIGQTSTTSLIDNNIAGDTKFTVPITQNPFSGANKYPRAVGYYEQRRVFAGSNDDPQTLYATRSGTEKNLNYSLPARADDAVSLEIAARELNTIRHIVPLQTLLVLTNSAEWNITGGSGGSLKGSETPRALPQSYIGASNVQPVTVNNNVIFAAARGGHMRELSFNADAGGYLTGDMSLYCPDLFAGKTIKQMAYQKAPFPVVWAVNSDGVLLGITYVPEQKVGGWHYHETGGGIVESVACIPEAEEDTVYLVVSRTVGGNTKRYIERFASRLWTLQEDCHYVDCGIVYSGAATATITGLSHLEGKTVNILADGAVQAARVVSSGQITLDSECTKVHVGLPIVAQLKPTPLVLQVDQAGGTGRPANVVEVAIRLTRSGSLKVGPSFDSLTTMKQRSNEPYDSPPRLVTGVRRVVLSPSWQKDGAQVCIQQDEPLPSTITAIACTVEVGG